MDEKTLKALVETIRKNLKIINKNVNEIDKENPDLIDFTIEEVIDRVLLYLNREDMPKNLERILAKIVNSGLKRSLKDIEVSEDDYGNIDRAVNSISDNGQSISYTNAVTNYFTSADDEELFSGFSSLLKCYRRIKVVYPENNE